MNPIIIVVVIIILLILYTISTYNTLIKARNKCEGQWAQIDVQLKRRNDLIPNIVETIKGYTKHEQETLENIIKARNTYNSAQTPSDQIESSYQIDQALNKLFALSEAYPDLKANTNFIKLQEELSQTEDKISYARSFYNDDAKAYKTLLETFPTNIIGTVFNFQSLPYYSISEEEKQNPQVRF